MPNNIVVIFNHVQSDKYPKMLRNNICCALISKSWISRDNMEHFVTFNFRAEKISILRILGMFSL
jgi:hypothetical protein